MIGIDDLSEKALERLLSDPVLSAMYSACASFTIRAQDKDEDVNAALEQGADFDVMAWNPYVTCREAWDVEITVETPVRQPADA